MAGFTPNYNLAFFDWHDTLNSPTSVQREIDRFVLIDRQIYGLYSVFGNGTISGWEVSDAGFGSTFGISVSIASGTGIIAFKTAVSNFPTTLNNLSPNSTLYIFAKLFNGSFPPETNASFAASSLSSISGYIKLAKVITGSNGITSIDNTDMDYLVVDDQINASIVAHKHRGAPSKIDLEQNTKNALFGAKIESFDADKITAGRFDNSRIPVLDHNDLENIGTLTHAGIDTYLNNFQSTNLRLLGEVNAVNRMKQTLYIEYVYPNLNKYFVNELDVIPGITSNTFIDYQNTTADLDLEVHTIAGFPFASTTSYFFTNPITLPSIATKGFIVANDVVYSDGSITYGVNTTNSTTWSDYEILTTNQVNTLTGQGLEMRVGIQIVSPSNLKPHDPYDTSFIDYIDFVFENSTIIAHAFQFKIEFYTDVAMTNLYLTKESKVDQTGWIVNDQLPIPVTGYTVLPGTQIDVAYYSNPLEFIAGLEYYFKLWIWDSVSYTLGSSGNTFAVATDVNNCYVGIPRVDSFAFMFELDNNAKIFVNP